MRSLAGGTRYTTFSSIFRNVANAREGGWDSSLPRWHLQQSIESADDEFVARIENATAPFWHHVLAAIESMSAG